ncbi:MAG TPA: S1C family serine protease [Candidatus Eisenbacteria bacterium]|nr:S1C family serine protease [Candidatus Eisenbacteria bacterium]
MGGTTRTKAGRIVASLVVLLVLAPVAWSAAFAPVNGSLRHAHDSIVRVMAIYPVRAPQEGAPQAKQRAHVASGVVMDDSGHVLTTASGLAGCIEIRVRTFDGRETTADLQGLDPATDLALLRIAPGAAPGMARAPSASGQVGAHVYAVAEWFGREVRDEPGRLTWRYDEPLRSLLQMTTPVHPGNSGGAVVDEQGRLVGVLIGNLADVHATDGLADNGNARGSAFAVPVDDLVPLMNDLARYGGVPRGFLGVSIQQGLVSDPEHPATPAVLGVTITDVVPNGPAWKAGIRSGDLVVAVDGQQVNSPDELVGRIMALRPGTATDLLWIRSDKEHRARVALTATPDSVLASRLEAAGAAARAHAQQRTEAEQH